MGAEINNLHVDDYSPEETARLRDERDVFQRAEEFEKRCINRGTVPGSLALWEEGDLSPGSKRDGIKTILTRELRELRKTKPQYQNQILDVQIILIARRYFGPDPEQVISQHPAAAENATSLLQKRDRSEVVKALNRPSASSKQRVMWRAFAFEDRNLLRDSSYTKYIRKELEGNLKLETFVMEVQIRDGRDKKTGIKKEQILLSYMFPYEEYVQKFLQEGGQLIPFDHRPTLFESSEEEMEEIPEPKGFLAFLRAFFGRFFK